MKRISIKLGKEMVEVDLPVVLSNSLGNPIICFFDIEQVYCSPLTKALFLVRIGSR